MDEKLNPYLEQTVFCDCFHPSLQELVREMGEQHTKPRDQAVALFYFVRDHIKSGMDRFDIKASETLAKGFSGCVGKSNLLIALMRAMGIPARYASIRMNKKVLRPLVTFGLSNLAFAKIPEYLPHVVCSLFFEDRWIYADCAFDREMYEMFFAPLYNWSIDWDGSNDLLVAREFLSGEFEYFASMDTFFNRNFDLLPPLFLTQPMFGIANRYSRGLRLRHRQKKTGEGRESF